MPLPTPTLDDRRFQDIVDDAKRMIPRFCPEWTDHNVSDPGITLIELFAWMTEMMLYRVNQVPDKTYTTFLNMLSIRRASSTSAQAPVTFYLSTAQPNEITIPRGTEVATIRTETSPAIVFTTEKDLVVRPPKLQGAHTRAVAKGDRGGWATHNLSELDLPNRQILIFPDNPSPGDAFYLAFDADISHHILALVITSAGAGGEGVDPRNPPLIWEAWQGGAARWVPCRVDHDGTGGFNYPQGELILEVPSVAKEQLQGTSAYWLRCRLTDAQLGPGQYSVSPAILKLAVEARGGTISCRHATTVTNEFIGKSDGSPGQVFHLANKPVLARTSLSDTLIVSTPGMPDEDWLEVPDFSASGPQDLHYVLDEVAGEISFGPTLLQPNGSVYSFGATPPRNSTLRFRSYQYGGGAIGNVPQGALAVLKTSIPYVTRVYNRERALGGLDPQTLEDARQRAPQILRARRRAVAADDYEYLACQLPDVARACCIAPGAQPGKPGEPPPGQVLLLIVPRIPATEGRIPPENLALSADIRGTVKHHIEEKMPLGIRLNVQPPPLFWVSVTTRLRTAVGSAPALRSEVQAAAERALYQYLNPYTGGPQGTGWPFGRELFNAELSSLLQRLAGLEFVEELKVELIEPGNPAPPRSVTSRITLPPGGLVCSHIHQVTVL